MKRTVTLLFVLIAIPASYQTSPPGPSGSVVLDEFSFDKITSKFEVTLIKFDVAYPYGAKHDAYISLVQDAVDKDDLLIAEVGVKDYGDRDNEVLAQRFNVKKEDFPVVKLLIRGKEPINFDDSKAGFTSDSLRRFIRENTGIYLSLPGAVKELDAVANKFMKANNEDRKKLLEETESVMKTLSEKDKAYGKIYKVIMDKILEKGDQFAATEYARVGKILSGKVSEEKKKELSVKVNILQSFKLHDNKVGKEDL
ncbi:endoplasmic reticulum resident protein 29 [Plutella xylostella]|uniref:endoplasmic reticulum resident protein 29 n=1 Tax=Plutella xylostella TaxID=51655 RepID=UPI0005D0447E|nr:endoplasmic reticulum resident protein 29 [Plutella xylostella]